jgi:N-acyl homoserine lactone hydrolase
LSLLLSVNVVAADSAPLVDSSRRAKDAGVKLYSMDCGRVEMRDMNFLADDGSLKGISGNSVVPCFLIRHPKGDLIWDTGLAEITKEKTATADADFKFSLKQTLSEQPLLLKLTPADINFVSFSHLHFDHAGNANLFARSTWIVDETELAHAFSEQAKDRGESVHYNQLQTADKIVIRDNSPYDVFGDGSVLIYRAPGHTAGHSILLVHTKTSGSVLLAGDLWITKDSRQRKLVPIYNDDKAATLQSMQYVEEVANAAQARIIMQHVTEDFDSLPTFPNALQ